MERRRLYYAAQPIRYGAQAMALLALGIALTTVGLGCSLLVLAHAFRRSLGTGFMVLAIPVYNLYYAFSQFEHPFKGLVLAGYLGCLSLGAWLQWAAVS
jgi:translocator protein